MRILKTVNAVPAGTFLVPLLLSALIYTIWPDLFMIGGLTETLFGGGSVNFIIAALCFFSGIGINVKDLGKLFKRHGVLLVVKFAASVALSLLFMAAFGQEGIFGISAVAFTVVISSTNPAAYISIVSESGNKIDQAAFGLVGLFGIPAVPVFIYGLIGGGGFDWVPVVSTIVPIIIGIVIGNLDPELKKLFSPGMTVMIPILGWNIGQGMNLLNVVSSGAIGLLLVVIFYILMSVLVVTDTFALKNDGVASMGMNAVATSASAFPAIIAQSNPSVEPFVASAQAQILAVGVVTIILTPIISRRIANKNSTAPN